MSKLIGVQAVTEYLKNTPVAVSKSTVYRLVRMNRIPYSRPTPQIILFDTDKLNAWINGEEDQAQ
jgi:excisionase family DNA binding protein